MTMLRSFSFFALLLLPAACATSTSGSGNGSSSGGNGGTASAACLDACAKFGGVCAARCDEGCSSMACGTIDNPDQLIGLSCTSNSLNFHYAGSNGGTGCSTGGSFAASTPRAPKGDAAEAKRVFVTSTTYDGNLKRAGGAATGLASADQLCNEVAASTNLGGTWVAWLSDSTHDAIERVEDVSPWYNVDRSAILFANKASLGTKPYDTFGPLLADETGKFGGNGATRYTWTGTSAGGRKGENFCGDWTTDGLGTYGDYITASYAGGWSSGTLQECLRSAALFCIEQ